MGKKYTVRCKGLDREGRGIVKFNNGTFSVPYLLPGEKAEISLVYGRRREDTGATLSSVTEPSPDRVDTECPYYRECGGCTLLHLSYEGQLRFKEQRISEMLSGLSASAKKNSPKPRLLPIIGAEEPFFYRNKIHATFGRDRKGHITTGLYREGTHELIPVRECRIENREVSAILKTIREFAEKRRLSVYREDTGTGLLRHVLFRVNRKNEVMVVPVVAESSFREKKLLAAEIVKKHPCVVTVVLNYNPKHTTMVLGTREEVLYGNGYLEDTIGDCVFRLSPRSFYQVNSMQTEKLYGEAVRLADIRSGETVVDAYCGTGTITLMMAKAAPDARFIGVELNGNAVRDAVSNAVRNRIGNAEFYEADAGTWLKRLAEEKTTVDVLTMDPPRSGSSPEFLKAVLALGPRRIVYVSCEPETLERDLKVLMKSYSLVSVQPVDMFPQTPKVESVVLLSKGVIDSQKVKVEFPLEDMDTTSFRGKATYEQIKDYVLQRTGMKVSSLYISQVKRKCGLEVGDSYNKPKSEETKQPQCPPEKETAIMDALKHFGMIE